MAGLARSLERLSTLANRGCELLLIPIVAFFVAVVVVAVVSRYVVGSSIVTSIELTRLSFNWACFLAAAVALHRGAHVRVIALVDAFPVGLRRGIEAAVWLAVLVLAVMMVQHGVLLTRRIAATYLPALGWSQAWLYASMPTCGALMALHALARLSGLLMLRRAVP
jgi:TRAP-type C4-dicarboxylate transport system permease small subunit